MRETKEQIIYGLLQCKGYMRMQRNVQASRMLTANDKNLVAYIFSYSNTGKENSTCTRTYKEFASELKTSCATVSRSFKKIRDVLPNALLQPRRATYQLDGSNLGKSYIILDYYFLWHPFIFSDGVRLLSHYAAQAAAIYYERFNKDAKSRPWKTDERQKFAIHAPMSVSDLADKLGCSEKTAANTIDELLDARIIYIKGRHKQLNGYFCRDFKPCLKLFETITEVRSKKSVNLEEARQNATKSEKQREAERDEKIAAARKKHADRYRHLIDKYNKFITLSIEKGGELTEEESEKWNEIESEIKQLDEFYVNSE